MKSFIAVVSVSVLLALVLMSNSKPKVELTAAERMYSAITAYADTFNVPLHIAFNVATIETSYRGPEDSTYNHKRISSAGAVGPMQIMPKYASWFAGFPVKRQELKDSIELNVWLSMKILNYQYNRFGTWEKALGAYNTGRPIINSYAKKAINPKYYLSKWM
jgi:soluble lytic murein transglycosylase-like protein